MSSNTFKFYNGCKGCLTHLTGHEFPKSRKHKDYKHSLTVLQSNLEDLGDDPEFVNFAEELRYWIKLSRLPKMAKFKHDCNSIIAKLKKARHARELASRQISEMAEKSEDSHTDISNSTESNQGQANVASTSGDPPLMSHDRREHHRRKSPYSVDWKQQCIELGYGQISGYRAMWQLGNGVDGPFPFPRRHTMIGLKKCMGIVHHDLSTNGLSFTIYADNLGHSNLVEHFVLMRMQDAAPRLQNYFNRLPHRVRVRFIRYLRNFYEKIHENVEDIEDDPKIVQEHMDYMEEEESLEMEKAEIARDLLRVRNYNEISTNFWVSSE